MRTCVRETLMSDKTSLFSDEDCDLESASGGDSECDKKGGKRLKKVKSTEGASSMSNSGGPCTSIHTGGLSTSKHIGGLSTAKRSGGQNTSNVLDALRGTSLKGV